MSCPVSYNERAQQESSNEDKQEVKKVFSTIFHFVIARR